MDSLFQDPLGLGRILKASLQEFMVVRDLDLHVTNLLGGKPVELKDVELRADVLNALLPPGQRGAHAIDSAALAPIVRAALRDGDVVLVKGALGSRMKLVVEALTAPGVAP